MGWRQWEAQRLRCCCGRWRGPPFQQLNNSPPHPLPSALQYGNGTLRLTTRQTYQLHGVLKQNLKTVFSTVIKNMGTTLGACGDVNRNVLAPPAPYKNRKECVGSMGGGWEDGCGGQWVVQPPAGRLSRG